jgi:hypothetical protein
MKKTFAMCLAAALAVPAFAVAANTPNEDDYIRQPVRFDQTFRRTVAGDCKYDLAVNGTITPLPDQPKGSIPMVHPNVSVSAQAACPNEEAVEVTDDVLGDGPLTWRQLEDSIAARARVVTSDKRHECTYAPKFRLVNAKLEIASFDQHCTAR